MRFLIVFTATVLACAGCRPAPAPGTMVSIPPPSTWQIDLEGYRQAKDEDFRLSTDSPLLAADQANFAGLDYYAAKPELYFVGPVNRYRSPERMKIITTSGKERPAEKYGWVRFPVGETTQTLQVYRLLDRKSGAENVEEMLVPFMDGTTGKETYPSGRYVNLRGASGGPYVLDFNLAYNPSCAYGAPERFACPVTPVENRLDVRIEAGERGYREPPAKGG